MNVLNSLGAFVVAIGLLVIVHELGHYLVMRWCGVRVLRFAFGFGKTLWSRRDKTGTEWALCLWPLGGYVKPLDTRDGELISAQDRPYAFDTQSVGKRIAMVVAGPLANFLLAILLYWVVFLSGVTEWRPILAAPEADSPAALAGIKAGDLVTRVDGASVETWAQTQWQLLQLLGKEPEIMLAVVETDKGQPVAGAVDRGVTFKVPADLAIGPTSLAVLGIRLGAPQLPAEVGSVQKDSAAQQAGLLAGDLIQTAAGQPIADWAAFVKVVRSHPDKPFRLSVLRQNTELALEMRPNSVDEQGQVIGRAGVSPAQGRALDAYRIHQSLNPAEALGAAITETWDKSRFTLIMLGQMLVGKASLDNLSGPISIASAAGQTAKIGLEAFLRFLAIVSLSLGVINLVPLPLLDGGHLMYYLVEILTGKPVSAERQALFQRFGIVVLGSLMFLAIYNDLQRLFNW